MTMRQLSILHESVKKQISIFYSEKGMFPFIVTANYHIFSVLLCLELDRGRIFFIFFTKKRQSVDFDRHFFKAS